MSKQIWEAQMMAGGMAPANTKVDPGAIEKVVARRYSGPALGDRVVVRLGADRLGPAEDLAMEFLGLAACGESKPIAQQSRRALGFASWALITHPENAKYALNLVKRIKAAARKAKSKPGHAWDQLTEMADELNRSVRHFLPPFWEEAARIYKDLGNTTYAGRAIGKALEAERVHALEVDPIRRRDAVLEFTLSGCLSGKSLTEYTKDIEKQFEPREAFDTLRDLLVRRTMGGMPPMPTAANDLARFAKAAGKNPEAEVESFLESIISSPAMSRAANQFWKSVSKHVSKLVANDDEFGVWLLVHTEPQSSWNSTSPVWAWLDLLEQWKVLPLLAKPSSELPPNVEIPGGRAGWISRLVGVEIAPNKRVFDLLKLAADVIRDEGRPIQFGQGNYYSGIVDVDVLEYCLELGLEVAEIPAHRDLDFSGWLITEVDHPRRNSQLTRLVADERFRPKVFAKIPQLVDFKGNARPRSYGRVVSMRAFELAAKGHEAIREVWWEFLDTQLKRLEDGALRDFEMGMEVACRCIGRNTAEEFPAILPRLQKIDVSLVLQRTLTAGVIDEYGWNAFDEADDAELLPQLSHRLSKLFPAFPWLTALQDGKVRVIGPDGYKTAGEFVMNAKDSTDVVLAVLNDVLLVYRDASTYERRVCWLSDANNPTKTNEYFYGFDVLSMIQHGDGVFYGSGILRPGDTTIPRPVFWLSDGERFWTVDNEHRMWNEFDAESPRTKPAGLHEIDPNTGKKVRSSIPAWFEQQLPAEGTIVWNLCRLMPAPKGTDSSPLGVRDGAIGWRVVKRRDGHHEGRGIDGRSHITPPNQLFAVAIVDQPAGDARWVIDSGDNLIDSASGRMFASVSSRMHRYCAGQASPLPIDFWHFFTVRCPASSKKLRGTKHEDARSLLDAAKLEHEALKLKLDEKNPDPNRTAGVTAVKAWLSEVPNRLATGISRVARIAAAEQISLDKLILKLEQDAGSVVPSGQVAPESIVSVTTASTQSVDDGLTLLLYPLEGCNTSLSRSYGSDIVSSQQITEVIEFFKTGVVKELTRGAPRYFNLIDDLPSAAWKAFWIHAHQNADDGKPVPERLKGPWLDTLAFLAGSGLYDLPGSITVFVASEPDEATEKKLKAKEKLPTEKRPVAFAEGKVRYVAFAVHNYQAKKTAILAYAEKGDSEKNPAKPPSGFVIEETIPLRKRWMSTSVRSFVDAVKSLETLPLIDAELLQSASERLNMSPIQVALGWMGNFRSVSYGQEKLTKELREHYGWKVNEIKTAVAALDADPPRLSVLSEGVRLDAKGCVGSRAKFCFESMVRAWMECQKEVVPISPEVIKKLGDAMPGYRNFDMKILNQLLSDPVGSPALCVSEVKFDYNREKHTHQLISPSFTPQRIINEDVIYPYLLRAICLLNYELPFADPVRRRLPELLETVRVFLDHENNTLPYGMHSTQTGWSAEPIEHGPVLEKFLGVVGKCIEGKDGLFRIDNGLTVGAIYPPAVQLRFRTSKLQSQEDYDALLAAASITFNYETDGSSALHHAQFTLFMRGQNVDSLISVNRSDEFAAGAWEQDPRVSVPKLVEQVAKKLKLGEDAAALYLQVLSLHDPTNARVSQWNGWTSKQLKAASVELVTGNHLVAAKRSRAGRDHFLPGGWEPLKAPNLPLEIWKLAMFGYSDPSALRGGYANLIVCPRVVAEQFEFAWNRVESGDAPKYEDAIV